MNLGFTKMHGAANDFVVIDHREPFLPADRTALFARLCDRHRGIGADGVLLLERGDLKMRKARVAFCLNLFGCAGFEIVSSDTLEDADLVVLCSADAEYLASAREVVPKVNVPVVVAGSPKDELEALTNAGVAGFVHAASDAVATLREWQDKLGMEA